MRPTLRNKPSLQKLDNKSVCPIPAPPPPKDRDICTTTHSCTYYSASFQTIPRSFLKPHYFHSCHFIGHPCLELFGITEDSLKTRLTVMVKNLPIAWLPTLSRIWDNRGSVSHLYFSSQKSCQQQLSADSNDLENSHSINCVEMKRRCVLEALENSKVSV